MMKGWGAKVDEKNMSFLLIMLPLKKWEIMCLIRTPFAMKKQITLNL